MKKEKAKELIFACLDEMYRCSTPPITWKEIEEKYVDVDEWWRNHTISPDDYMRIKEKYAKMLPVLYRESLAWALLDWAPMEK